MKKHNRIILSFLTLLVLLITSIIPAAAEETDPRADIVFNSARVSLSSSKSVTFTASTKSPCTIVSTAVYITRRNDDGTWSGYASVPVPTLQVVGGTYYNTTVSYASYITDPGTYRVHWAVNASGHTISATSNTCTW